MEDGDVAFGEDGADRFYISTSSGGKMAIGGFNWDDSIYVDGSLFKGEPRSYSWRKEGTEKDFQIIETVTVGGPFDPRVLERVIIRENKYDGEEFNSYEFWDLSYETNPFVEVGGDNGKSLEFKVHGNTGLFTFHNGSATTKLLVSGIMGGWGSTNFLFAKEGRTETTGYIDRQKQEVVVTDVTTIALDLPRGANFGGSAFEVYSDWIGSPFNHSANDQWIFG
jgi:hypothetical protein